MAKDSQAQMQMAVAALGVTFAKALVEREPSLLASLRESVMAAYHQLNDRGDKEAAIPLGMLSRALHDKNEFPQA